MDIAPPDIREPHASGVTLPDLPLADNDGEETAGETNGDAQLPSREKDSRQHDLPRESRESYSKEGMSVSSILNYIVTSI